MENMKSEHLKILIERLINENIKLEEKIREYQFEKPAELNARRYVIIATEYINYHTEMISFIKKLDKEIQAIE